MEGVLSWRTDSIGVLGDHLHFLDSPLQFVATCTDLRWRSIPSGSPEMIYRWHAGIFSCWVSLGPLWEWKQRWTQEVEVGKILFVEERRERLHGGMQQDPEIGGPMGQVENWVFRAFFIAWGQKCLSGAKRHFLGRRNVSLVNYHLLGPPVVHPLRPWVQTSRPPKN
jgi:hypothetical protein